MENNSNPSANIVIRVDGSVRPRSNSEATVATVQDDSTLSSFSSFSSSSETQTTKTTSVENTNESLSKAASIISPVNATGLLSPQQTQHQK